MSKWRKDELRSIAKTDNLHISPFRDDGKSYGTRTWIWSVVVDSDLYVRAYNGKNSRWYQAALRQNLRRNSSRPQKMIPRSIIFARPKCKRLDASCVSHHWERGREFEHRIHRLHALLLFMRWRGLSIIDCRRKALREERTTQVN